MARFFKSFRGLLGVGVAALTLG
ncbi:polysaccharide export protein, partial [Pseudomonas sp. FW215-R3]